MLTQRGRNTAKYSTEQRLELGFKEQEKYVVAVAVTAEARARASAQRVCVLLPAPQNA